MAIKVAKDRKSDVAYVQFRQARVSKTIEIRPGVLMDLDTKGNVVGIEVLSLSTLAPVLKAIPRAKRSGRSAAA